MCFCFSYLTEVPSSYIYINIRTKVRENTREFGTLERRDAAATPIPGVARDIF